MHMRFNIFAKDLHHQNVSPVAQERRFLWPTTSKRASMTMCNRSIFNWACESLLTLQGMQYSTEGHKCLPFSSQFKTLGLEVDTREFAEGHVLVGHTQNRREELHNQLEAFLCANSTRAKDAERLRGRMIFFKGVHFWKSCQCCS